jgi:hypothetical protein
MQPTVNRRIRPSRKTIKINEVTIQSYKHLPDDLKFSRFVYKLHGKYGSAINALNSR